MSDFFNQGKRRLFLLEGFEEIFKICFNLRFNMNFYAKADIFDPAFIVKLIGQPVDKRPDSYPLDHSKNDYLNSVSFLILCFIIIHPFSLSLRGAKRRGNLIILIFMFLEFLAFHTIYASTVVLAVESVTFTQFDAFSEAFFLFEIGL